MIHVLITAAGVVLLLFISVMLSDWISLGFFKVRREAPADAEGLRGARGEREPDRERINRNCVERQKGESCGGYAAAYMLRSFGIPATGDEVYAGMFKIWKGRVWVREVRRQLAMRGLRTGYWRGTPEILRRELDKGDPVILLLNTNVSSLTLHFAVAAGYSEGVFYIADSAKPVVNYGRGSYPQIPGGIVPGATRINGPFNRIVTEKELLEIWDTGSVFMPFHRFTYITVESAPGQAYGE